MTGEAALERAMEIVRKAGWFMVWATEVRREDDRWVVTVDTLLRRFVVVLGPEGDLVELREERPAGGG